MKGAVPFALFGVAAGYLWGAAPDFGARPAELVMPMILIAGCGALVALLWLALAVRRALSAKPRQAAPAPLAPDVHLLSADAKSLSKAGVVLAYAEWQPLIKQLGGRDLGVADDPGGADDYIVLVGGKPRVVYEIDTAQDIRLLSYRFAASLLEESLDPTGEKWRVFAAKYVGYDRVAVVIAKPPFDPRRAGVPGESGPWLRPYEL